VVHVCVCARFNYTRVRSRYFRLRVFRVFFFFLTTHPPLLSAIKLSMSERPARNHSEDTFGGQLYCACTPRTVYVANVYIQRTYNMMYARTMCVVENKKMFVLRSDVLRKHSQEKTRVFFFLNTQKCLTRSNQFTSVRTRRTVHIIPVCRAGMVYELSNDSTAAETVADRFEYLEN
jgi:hypothetical protein